MLVAGGAPSHARLHRLARHFKRPAVAGERPEQVDGIQNRVGIQEGKTQIRRIDIAKSNDLAYEFSQQDVTYDEADTSGKVTSRPVTTSILRVWKKTWEQWMIAAAFSKLTSSDGRLHLTWSGDLCLTTLRTRPLPPSTRLKTVPPQQQPGNHQGEAPLDRTRPLISSAF